MRLYNFRNLRKVNEFYFAEVCARRGIWPFRKVHTYTIMRQLGCNWVFWPSGKFTPGLQAEQLEQVYLAEKRIEDEGAEEEDL